MKPANLFCTINKVIEVITHEGIVAILKNSSDCPLATSKNQTNRFKIERVNIFLLEFNLIQDLQFMNGSSIIIYLM